MNGQAHMGWGTEVWTFRHAHTRRGMEALAASHRRGLWGLLASATDVDAGLVGWELGDWLAEAGLAVIDGHDIGLTAAGRDACLRHGLDLQPDELAVPR